MEVDILALAALRRGPAHGYALIERLRDTSDGVLDFPEGTIYPLLHRLERDRLVTSRWEAVGGRRRRVYRLTARGRRALEREQQRWRSLRRAVDVVLGEAT